MPSIRRNLLGYLLLLLALCLGGVGMLVDRFAQAAMRAREESETRRIEEAYKVREKEVKDQFDAELVAEAHKFWEAVRGRMYAQVLGATGTTESPFVSAIRPPDDEIALYHKRVAVLLVGLGPATSSWAEALVGGAASEWPRPPQRGPGSGEPPRAGRPNPAAPPPPPRLPPLWTTHEAPRALARLQDALQQSFETEEPRHRGEFQIRFVVTDTAHKVHNAATVSPQQGHDLPLNADGLEANPKLEYLPAEDIEVEGAGRFRAVLVRAGLSGWQRAFVLTPPVPTTGLRPDQRLPGPRQTDLQVHVYVQSAQPHSALTDRLAQDRDDRDDQLARVGQETRLELAQLRAKLLLIGCGTFAALVVGGWLIVARGLYPVRKLSEAVSRVSEKDFRLPVRDDELSRELVPIHSRLTQTLDLLRRAFAREKQAVADISHELRTPIASLLATLDVALRKPRTPEQYRTTLEDCRVITRQLSQLVERIMTLASLDAGTTQTNRARFDASEVSAGCAAVIRPLATAHGLTLEVRAAPPLELDSDPDKLREVLVNLLHNAVEYNRPGGTVELLGRREKDRVVLEVRDTGIGMTPEVREKIFERFFRADPSRQATGVHAGLGLAIVKEYVERLGGTIVVESQAGVGSTFRVELPAAPEEPEEPAPPVPITRPDARSPGDPVPSGS
jgi:signal transduction histidine kinase